MNLLYSIRQILKIVRQKIHIILCILIPIAILNLYLKGRIIYVLYNLFFCLSFLAVGVLLKDNTKNRWWESLMLILFWFSLIGMFLWPSMPVVFLLSGTYIIIRSLEKNYEPNFLYNIYYLIGAFVISTSIKIIINHDLSLFLDSIVVLLLLIAILEKVIIMGQTLVKCAKIVSPKFKLDQSDDIITFSIKHIEKNLKKDIKEINTIYALISPTTNEQFINNFFKLDSFIKLLQNILKANNKIDINIKHRNDVYRALSILKLKKLSYIGTIVIELIINTIKYAQRATLNIYLQKEHNLKYLYFELKTTINPQLKNFHKRLILYTTLKIIISLINEKLSNKVKLYETFNNGYYIKIGFPT